ncbi:hypothetical protein [Cyanobium sp. ULC065]|nr:hypothetical protein [Synechococcus sp. CS-1333]
MVSIRNLVHYLLLVASIGITLVIFNFYSGTIAIFTAAALPAELLNIPVTALCRYLPRG